MTEPNIIYREARTYSSARRAFDLLVATIALLVSAPVLAAAALAIVIEDGFPLLFIQTRVGRFGRPFRIYKLRTMRTGACARCATSRPTAKTSRITRVGRVPAAACRSTSCRSSSTCCAVRWRSSDRGRRCRSSSTATSAGNICDPWYPRGSPDSGRHSTLQRPAGSSRASLIDLEYVKRASTRTDVSLFSRTFASVIFPRGAF